MDDISGKVQVFPEHFQPSSDSENCVSASNLASDRTPRSHSWALKGVIGAASFLNLLNLRHLRWPSTSEDDEKVEISRAELETLRSEISEAEERETYLKAQLENIDEVLRCSIFSGYLYIRTRWTVLPGEPPILDDSDIDDWLPRFVVLQGSYLYFYLKSTDLSPQDSTKLSDIVEVGSLPGFPRQDKQMGHAFYMLTRHGLRFECSSSSDIQVDSWLRTLKESASMNTTTSGGRQELP